MARKVACVAVGLLLAIGAAGCGGDDDVEVVTVGVVAPLDAGLTQFGRGIRNSVELAVVQANAMNLLDGRRIVVQAVDDSSDASVGARNAAAIAGNGTVIGVVGTYNSGVARVVAPQMVAAGITMISPGNTDPSLTLGPDRAHPERQFSTYFRVVANDSLQGIVLAQFAAADLAIHRAAVVADAKQVSQGLANDFRAAFEAAGGDVVSFEIVPEGDTDYAPFAQRAAAAEPELLFFGGEYDHAALLKTAAVGAGLAVPLMGGDGIQADDYITAAGAISEGDLATSVGAPIEQEPRGTAFLEAYEDQGFSDPPTTFGPYAYDAANILIAAARAALHGGSKVDGRVRTDILANVQAGDDDLLSMFGGPVTGEIGFDAFGDTINPVLTVYRVEGGKWVPLATR